MRHRARLFTSLVVLALAGCAANPPDCPEVTVNPLEHASDYRFSLLEAVPRTNRSRQDSVAALFSEADCDQLEVQRVNGRNGSNVICTIKGRQAEAGTVLVGAHFDTYPGSPGVADNWTGVSVLVSMADHFTRYTPASSVSLVAFAGEELDLLGSRRFTADRARLPTVMINVDTLGLGPLQYERRSDKGLACIANRIGITRAPIMRDTTGDWEMFRRVGVPALALQSLQPSDRRLIHSPRDTIELIEPEVLAQSYQQVMTLVSHLANSEIRQAGR